MTTCVSTQFYLTQCVIFKESALQENGLLQPCPSMHLLPFETLRTVHTHTHTNAHINIHTHACTHHTHTPDTHPHHTQPQHTHPQTHTNHTPHTHTHHTHHTHTHPPHTHTPHTPAHAHTHTPTTHTRTHAHTHTYKRQCQVAEEINSQQHCGVKHKYRNYHLIRHLEVLLFMYSKH